jgi:hypothetical protein
VLVLPALAPAAAFGDDRFEDPGNDDQDRHHVEDPEVVAYVGEREHRSPPYPFAPESRYSPKQVKATITASIQYWEAVARR